MSGLLGFEKATLGYGRKAVLHDVDVQFDDGDFVGLVGPNGSGKTTFLRSVLGLAAPLAGRVWRSPDRRFAYVPQADEINLFWPLTVREIVQLPLRSRRWGGRLTSAESEAVEKAMARTGVLSLADRLLRDLSGGQRQRAVIAQAVVQGPDVVLLDEPTKGMDVVAERDLLALIGGLSEEGATVFLVSHTLHIPLNYCRRLLLFHASRVMSTHPEEILASRSLEKIYGVPFEYMAQGDHRWAMPERRP